MGEDEFTALFHALSRRLFSYAARRLSPQAAEDVVAQTFETVWDKRDECPTDADAQMGWIFAIGRLKVLQESDRRSRKHHDNRFVEDHVPRPVQEPDVSEVVVESANGRWIYDHLTADEREFFDIAFMRHLSRSEASAMLEIPIGTFNTRVSRLRGRIKTLQGQANAADLTLEGGRNGIRPGHDRTR